MIVWILLALTMIGDKPVKEFGVFNTSEACETAKTQVMKSFLIAGATDGAVSCTPIKIELGKFS